MLGKQWKAEPDEVRAHYKALADEQKKKHAEQHPDYQYAPRRPCERKRRASSRQYPKHSKAAAAAGVAAAGKGSSSAFQAESPTSISSTATFSNSSASTPGMQNGINMDHDLSSLNVFLGPNDLQDEQFNFDTVSFDAMVQQLRNSQNPDILLQPLNPTEQAGLESFEFSDFIADCFWPSFLSSILFIFVSFFVLQACIIRQPLPRFMNHLHHRDFDLFRHHSSFVVLA